MKTGVRIKQHDITDCGAACLASISAHYGLNLPIAKIRQMASTDRKGTNVLGLIEAAGKLGFEVKAVKSKQPDGTNNVEPLQKIPTPAIAHVIKNEKLLHYEVIYSVKKDRIQIMDPGTGELEWIKIEDFNKEWTGILLRRDSEPICLTNNQRIMKSFEVKALGLEEMNQNEIVSTNGGGAVGLIIALAVFVAGVVLCLVASKGKIQRTH